jgi:ubiquinone/menaquinone biosynthesis C-methylase UbiE
MMNQNAVTNNAVGDSAVSVSGANIGQKDFWTSGGGKVWVHHEADLNATFAPVDHALVAAAQINSNETVLDLGCGTGGTSRAVAAAMGGGSVLGLDIAAPMVERATVVGGRGLRYQVGDAQTYDFQPQQFDLLVSRFGSMFFADPVAAFENLFRAMKPEGRIVLACWRRAKENPWFSVPFKAALDHIGAPDPVDPFAPGPTSFADPERVRSVLSEAGFKSVDVQTVKFTLHHPGPFDRFVDLMTTLGPLASLIARHDPSAAQCEAARLQMAEGFRPAVTEKGVEIAASLNIVTATASVAEDTV